MSYRGELQRELFIFGVLIGFVLFCIAKVIAGLTCFRKSSEIQTQDDGGEEWEDASDEEEDD